jgi:hypothetical protein
MPEPEVPFVGGSHSAAVRVGPTVRRVGRPWSPATHDLLRHLEGAGFTGAPRALGFDDQGREVLTYVDGATVRPSEDHRASSDDVLVRLGALLRAHHDAAASFPWHGRVWQVPVREPVETICHNDLSPGNVIFRAGVPVAFIDWEAAAPGPRAWDLGYAAWHWVPLRSPRPRTTVAEAARRYRLLLHAYGVEPHLDILQTGIERMRQYLAHLWQLVADGSEWEVRGAERGELDAFGRDLEWVEAHATDLVRP